MTNNGKEGSKKSKNAYRKKRNGRVYLVMEKGMKMRKGMKNVGEEGTTENGKDYFKKEKG